MNKFFRRLPLRSKLVIVGLIPFCFLIYLTVQLYNQKTEKLKLFDNYKTYMAESADISGLIDALQEERKFSFDFAMTRSMHPELVLQRPITNKFLQKLTSSKDPALAGFTNYTKLGTLNDIRNRVDSFTARPEEVMHFYSNTVFRLNTLNTIPPANTPYLQPLYKDLMVQKILSEMITYLGIIRSNIYNVLHTRKYMVETLFGTIGAHDMYNSYESELLEKASPPVLEQYKIVRNTTALKPTVEHIDTLFKRFTFDSSYTAAAWWKVSDEGTNVLRGFQNTILSGLNTKINNLYSQVHTERKRTLIFLVIALICVSVVVLYIAFIIGQSLRKLRLAAEKIAGGETGVDIQVESNDVIGKLAGSVSTIDKSNRLLADAATAIGKGNFDFEVSPRSKQDILGNAIVKMKQDLQQYNQKMELLVAQRTEELARSNEDLLQFAHVASHDLKEPLRKISTFSNFLNAEEKGSVSEKGKVYLQKIELSSKRMSDMIEAILTYSTINVNERSFSIVDLNKVMEDVLSDLELVIIQKEAQVNYKTLPHVKGIPTLLQQLFCNLINNALKFSKEDVKPVIDISAKEISLPADITQPGVEQVKYAEIIISDNGIGFNQQYAEKMFGVFYRLNSKDKYEGTGLGLALCRKIVMRHNGKIYAEGEEDKGARFHILLPVED